MRTETITISDNGSVTVPGEVRMSISEIAHLFGIFYQTAKSAIRAVQKSDVADGDYTAGGTVEGLKVYPDYYGLDMVIAVAFRVQSANAKILRNWIIKKAVSKTAVHPVPIIVQCNNKLFIC